MAIVEKELQYLKDGRFLKHKPTTMYPNPFRVQFFHDAHEGLHGRSNVFLNHFYDTTFVHMAPANPYGTFYNQIENLLEYHPHICVGEGYGALILYHLLCNKKYDGNSVLLYLPIDQMKNGIVLPKKGKHCLVFEDGKNGKNMVEFAEKMLNKVKVNENENEKMNEIQKDENEERIVMKKGNVSIYIIKMSRNEFNDVENVKKEKFTLKNVVDTVCDKDLAFSRLQDKGMVWFNAFILFVLFIIAYGLIGVSMRTKQLEDGKTDKKE